MLRESRESMGPDYKKIMLVRARKKELEGKLCQDILLLEEQQQMPSSLQLRYRVLKVRQVIRAPEAEE